MRAVPDMLKRSRTVVLLAAVVGAALTARLGIWQLDRAAQKIAWQTSERERAALPALDLQTLPRSAAAVTAEVHRAVTLQGRWLAARTVYLENRQMRDVPGFYAVTPLQLASGEAVLVQRGWLPRDPMDRTRIVAAAAPEGAVQVQGRIATRPARLVELGAAAPGPIRQNLAIDAYALETGLPLLPLLVIQQDAADISPDGLLRDWPEVASGVHKHYGYAFQWFALSALIVGLTAWFQFIRPRLQPRHVVA
ncbi:MAG: SURF1 family protein [Rubrivivax sp.]